MVGTCELMCPAAERAERERDGNVRIFERVDPNNPNLSSDELAVKTFVRTAVRCSLNKLSHSPAMPSSYSKPCRSYTLTCSAAGVLCDSLNTYGRLPHLMPYSYLSATWLWSAPTARSRLEQSLDLLTRAASDGRSKRWGPRASAPGRLWRGRRSTCGRS